MDNDEIERSIEFIINQQALFAEQFAQMAAEMKQMDERLGKLTDVVLTVTGMVGRIAEAQVKAIEAQTQTDTKIAELAEQGIETQERLNAFIVVVERFISESRNGKHGE